MSVSDDLSSGMFEEPIDLIEVNINIRIVALESAVSVYCAELENIGESYDVITQAQNFEKYLRNDIPLPVE